MAPVPKPTPGKTPVPAKTVTPGKPVPRRAPALTPTQYAQQQVNASLAPLYVQAKSQANYQNSAINNYTKAIIAQLRGLPAQVGASYDQAIGQQTNLSNAAAESLRAANPNTQDQALLSAINAPASQQAQLAGQNNNAFNGAAAVGQYVGGVLPLGALQSQKLAAETQARLQPGFEALRGQQALSGALYQQGQDRQKIAAQEPGLVQSYLSDRATQSARNQQLALERQAYGLKAGNQKFNQNLATNKQNLADRKFNAQQDQFIKSYNMKVNTFNAKQTNAASKMKQPNASLSRATGYLVDSNGNPITGSNGKPQILPGFKVSNGQIVKVGTTRAGKAAGVFADLTKTQVSTLRATANELRFGTKDSKGNVKPPLSYPAAIRFLVGHGFSRNDAAAMLNNFYPPGQAGRPSAAARKAVKAANARARKGKDATGLGIQVGA